MFKANNKKNRNNKNLMNNFRIESLEPRFMMDASVDYETFTNAEHFQTEITEQLQNFETADLSNLGLNGAQVEASALFNGIATDAVQKFNTLQNQIASQLNDPDAGLSGIVRQDGEIVSVDKATLLSVLANMDISGLDISMEGDLVDVSYAYAGSGNLPQMSLDTLDMAVAANDSLSVGAGSGGLIKSVNADQVFKLQDISEIHRSAPLSAADIQALLSIDPDNLGGSGNTKV